MNEVKKPVVEIIGKEHISTVEVLHFANENLKLQLKTVTAQRDIAVEAIKQAINFIHPRSYGNTGIGLARRQEEFRVLEEALAKIKDEGAGI